MKFTKEEKILLTMYAYVERQESIDVFQQLKQELAPVSAKAHELVAGVENKLSKMSDSEYDQMEFFPDELIPMIIGKPVEEVAPSDLLDVVELLKAEFDF